MGFLAHGDRRSGFIGYAVLFLVRNSTDSFLELGIGPHEVPVGKDAIQQFGQVPLHQPPAHRRGGLSSPPPGWRCSLLAGRLRRQDLPIKEGNRTCKHQQPLLCAKCGEATDGWKCAICGSVAREHDPDHLHIGSDRYCTLRCAGCGRPTSTAPACSCLTSNGCEHER